VSAQPDSRSHLTQIDLILSRVISSLVSPRDVSWETIESARQQLESARQLLQPDLDSTRWHLGIEGTGAGVKAVFFSESGGTIDLYPLAWSLAQGESDRLPLAQVDRYLVQWLANLSPDQGSWLYEALQELSGIWIASEDDTEREAVKKALIAAQLCPSERVYSLEMALAVALAYIPLDPLPAPESLLVIHGGQRITELALLEVSGEPGSLSRSSIAFSQWLYGKDAFSRALLDRLLYPQWRVSIPADSGEGYPAERSLLEAARLTLLVLQERSPFTSQLAGREWTVSREDLQERAIEPFIRELQAEISNFLEKNDQDSRKISQMILSGDLFLSLWPFLAEPLTRWFPQMEIVPPSSPSEMSPAIVGLGRVPLFPFLAGESGNND
jgi:hypothetical protein